MKMQAKWMGQERMVEVPEEFVPTIEALNKSKKGTIAWLNGHKSGATSSKCIKPGISNRKVVANFNYDNFKKKKYTKVSDVTFEQVMEKIPKIATNFIGMSVADLKSLFNTVKNEMLFKLSNEDGVDQAKSEGQNRNYAYVGEVKLHLVNRTAVKADGPEFKGKKLPVTLNSKNWDDSNAIFAVDGVMVNFIQLHEEVIEEGIYQETVSSDLTVMKNLIEGVVKYDIKMVNLGLGNYDSFNIDHNSIIPENEEIMKD